MQGPWGEGKGADEETEGGPQGEWGQGWVEEGDLEMDSETKVHSLRDKSPTLRDKRVEKGTEAQPAETDRGKGDAS